MAASNGLLIATILGFAVSCHSFVILNPKQCGFAVETAAKRGATIRHERRNHCTMTELPSSFDRRNFLAVGGMIIATTPLESAFSIITAAPTSSPLVVEGQMRLEVGSDKKLEASGGRGMATVYLRCVGKGIISKTSLEIDVVDFPPPGQPKPGEGGGVPFFVTETDLNEKTEKGKIVNKEMWGDDDIFVRVDVDSTVKGETKRVLTGIGKAKYAIGPDGKGYHQKPLVLLE